MSVYVQEQITQELHDLAFNKCYEEDEGTPKFLTLMEAHVELELEFPTDDMPRPCLVSTPVQGSTPQAVQASASREENSYICACLCQLARSRPCTLLPLANEALH
ncbi:hypothetical protein JCGZ_10840 [Jatropha curcas]|uniref:Uncharacterized protein n=1 Tax=Jatropha curcas TaxID=180498 RepID=A0A067KU30_JATCU|nr:hypothetical protein JCGZ_10840 [Jatropha curcas]